MANIVTTLFSDSAKTNALYPRTKTSAVSDNDGNTLGNIAVWNALDVASGVDTVKVGLDMDLLWTNSSPTTAFSAQTIAIDLSGYIMVYIEARWATDDAGKLSAISRVGYGGYISAFYNAKQSRGFDVTSSGVQFYDAVYGATATTTMATNNSQSIPLRIYGIR